jgi:hypothetical protein
MTSACCGYKLSRAPDKCPISARRNPPGGRASHENGYELTVEGSKAHAEDLPCCEPVACKVPILSAEPSLHHHARRRFPSVSNWLFCIMHRRCSSPSMDFLIRQHAHLIRSVLPSLQTRAICLLLNHIHTRTKDSSGADCAPNTIVKQPPNSD